ERHGHRAGQNLPLELAFGLADIRDENARGATTQWHAMVSRKREYMTFPYANMTDNFGRDITYLRVSVTDRCDFRCTYCMAEDMTFLPKKDLLSLEELERLCSVFIAKGVRKLRLTGGEPLVRRNV